MKLKPMADNILLKAHEAAESTASGILLASSTKEKPAIYDVVSVGPDCHDVAVGDKVVVRPQPDADNGDIVVALLEDEATVKRLWREHGAVWLLPENPAFRPIDGREATILGKVKAVIREY